LQVLNLLAPDYFDATWLSKVTPVVGGDNKRLKANNVRKVVGSTIDYLKDLAGVQLHQFPLPDVNQVSPEFNYPVPVRYLGNRYQYPPAVLLIRIRDPMPFDSWIRDPNPG
jgi:hypothetical protein